MRRAITTMQDNLGEQITVDDLARAAMFSKFHFSRLFHRATGVSPGRFLSALRLQRAKHLLTSTQLNVVDISLRVGYNSVGTFSSRFRRSVGMSPTTYRRLKGFAPSIVTDARPHRGHPSDARISGAVSNARPGLIFVGLFADRIPEGQPVHCAVLPGPGAFRFDAVPAGTWYLLAQSVPGDPYTSTWDPRLPSRTVSVATQGPLTIRQDTDLEVDLELQPARALDPPVLIALLDARKLAKARASREAEQFDGQPVAGVGCSAA